jgi:hypothetical protein
VNTKPSARFLNRNENEAKIKNALFLFRPNILRPNHYVFNDKLFSKRFCNECFTEFHCENERRRHLGESGNSDVKSHCLQTNFLVNVIPQSELVGELLVAVLAGVDGRLGVLDDHVPAKTEGMDRHLAAQLAPVVLGVVFRIDAVLQELHDTETT